MFLPEVSHSVGSTCGIPADSPSEGVVPSFLLPPLQPAAASSPEVIITNLREFQRFDMALRAYAGRPHRASERPRRDRPRVDPLRMATYGGESVPRKKISTTV